jgi:hypothetical protein
LEKFLPNNAFCLFTGWGHGVLNLESSAGYAQSWNGEHKLFSHDVPHQFLHQGREVTLNVDPEASGGRQE